MPMEKTLTTLLAAEAEARGIVEKAEKEAREIREQTEKQAQEIIEEARKKEEQETKQVLEKARSQIQSNTKEILDQAEREAQHWEELFQQNRDQVLKFIIKEFSAIVVEPQMDTDKSGNP